MSNTAEQLQIITAPKLPLRTWMPRRWRAAAAGRAGVLVIPDAVRRRCRKPKPMLPSELSVAYRRMPAAEGHPGAYRFEFAKHARKPMDIWALPWVRRVVFCGVDQASKTNCMLSCIFYAIDQAPGNIFYQMPSADASDKIMGQKLNPMIKESPRVAVHVSNRADDVSLGKTVLTNGMTILPAHAGSVTSTATFAATYTFSDEVDKMEMVGREASPITRILKRTRTKKFGKHFFASTPAGKYIYQMALACVQVWEGTVRCPFCGELMEMSEDQVIIPEGATAEEIKTDPSLVEYACDKCGQLLNEIDRNEAYRRIESDNDCWRCIKGAEISEPVDVGFVLSAFPIPDVPLVDIADTIIKAKAGDISACRDLAHGIKAIDYKPELSANVDVEIIYKFRSELPRNLVPPDTVRLALLVDTQQSSFYFQVWAYGYAPEVKMHMIRHGIVETFDDVKGLLREVYLDHEGTEHRISNGLIDSGGTKASWQKHSRTVEVYEWCSRHRGMVPLKGIHGRTGDLIHYKNMETYPGTNKRIPGGLKRANVRVDLFKDELERRLGVEPDDPSALSFHMDIDEAFAKHYTGETKDEAGDWKHDKKQRIDYWDCTNYALVLREIIKLRLPKKQEPEEPEVKIIKTPMQQALAHRRRQPGKGGFVTGWK